MNVLANMTGHGANMAILRLGYAELGERLNRSPDAVRVLARRRGWQRVNGNDGRVVVLVDDAEIEKLVHPDVRVNVHPNVRPDRWTPPPICDFSSRPRYCSAAGGGWTRDDRGAARAHRPARG